MFIDVHKNKPADLQFRMKTFLHFAKIYVGKYCLQKAIGNKMPADDSALEFTQTWAEVVRKP